MSPFVLLVFASQANASAPFGMAWGEPPAETVQLVGYTGDGTPLVRPTLAGAGHACLIRELNPGNAPVPYVNDATLCFFEEGLVEVRLSFDDDVRARFEAPLIEKYGAGRRQHGERVWVVDRTTIRLGADFLWYADETLAGRLDEQLRAAL